MTFKTLIHEGDWDSTKIGIFSSIANCHHSDILLRVKDPLRELAASGCANFLVSVLSKDPIVELLAYLCFQ
jgi:hypothetical protein